MSWIWAELQQVFRGQEITLVVIKQTKNKISLCVHTVCLSGVAQECRIGVLPASQICLWETTPGEHPVPLTSPELSQERIWDTSLKTANVTASRLRLANSLLFPASSTDSLALFFSLCHRETQIKPFGEGGLGAKAFTPPRAPFCHPSCFAQQQLHSVPAAPGHGLPDLTSGGLYLLVFMKAWGRLPVGSGGCWCCKVGEMQEVEYYLQFLPEAQSAGP